MRANDADVIIVGGGPVGMTLALLLAQRGTSVLVCERHERPFSEPRAVGIDDETLRTWQNCGVLDAIQPFILAGPVGETIFTYRDGTGRRLYDLQQRHGNLGYPEGAVFLQPSVEAVLRQHVMQFACVRFCSGFTVTHIQQDANSVEVRGTQATGHPFSFSSAYVVGCDGAKSLVREHAGIVFEGRDCPESWLILDTYNRHHDTTELPEQGVEVWCDPVYTGVTVPLPRGYRRWEIRLTADECGVLEHDGPALEARISRFRKGPLGEIIRKKEIRFSARQAAQYRKGRILIAGDAAHVTPPFAAQGLVSGIRDVANLSWKLSAVVSQEQPDALLDSYDCERRAHQRKMIQLALALGRLMMPHSRVEASLVHMLFACLQKMPPRIQNCFVLRGNHLQPHLHAGFLGHRGGRYFPQAEVRMPNGHTCLIDHLLGNHIAVVSFCSRPISDMPMSRDVAAMLTGTVTHLVCGRDFVDFSRAYAEFAHEYVIVRPDRVIYARIRST